MSEEKDTKAKDDVHDAPKCCEEGCESWGIAGYAPSKNVEPRWWCWPHYPHKFHN